MRVDPARIAALRKHPVNLQVSYPCKIHIWVDKCVDGARWHLDPSLSRVRTRNLTGVFRTVNRRQFVNHKLRLF